MQIRKEALLIREIAPSFKAKPVKGGKPLKERSRRSNKGDELKDQKNRGVFFLSKSMKDVVIIKYIQK